MVNSTPSTPPDAQTRKEVQNGKPVHQPMITRLGRMKMIDAMRAGRRTDGLDDIVLADIGAGKQAQKGHRDHRGGDRGGEGEPHLQSQIHIGGGEKEGERHAQGDTAPGEFFALRSCTALSVTCQPLADFALQTPAQGNSTKRSSRDRAEAHALIKRQRAGMVQGAGVDRQPLDRLRPGVDAGVIEEKKAQALADRLRHQAEIGDVGGAVGLRKSSSAMPAGFPSVYRI